MSMELSVIEFNRALQEIRRIDGKKTDAEIITFTAQQVVRKLVARTPQISEAGIKKIKKYWSRVQKHYESGKRVDAGEDHPVIQRARQNQSLARMGWAKSWDTLGIKGALPARNSNVRRRGWAIDGRNKIGEPYFDAINHSKVAVALDAKKKIVSGALQWQLRYMRKFIDRQYTKMLKSKSA